MNIRIKGSATADALSLLRARLQHLRETDTESPEPFRAELYSSRQLNRHGKLIAANHKLLQYKVADRLLKRLESNEQKLVEVRNVLVEEIRAGKAITPAGEWLLDNFYLIEEQVVLARQHLPKGYSEGLPYLSNDSKKVPRVYDITLEIINHSDGHVDKKGLGSFIASYQSETILTLGELWAIPIMLRLAVIENLRRIGHKIMLDIADHNLADHWADRLMQKTANDPANIILVLADMVRSQPLLNSPFVAGFIRRLQGHGNTLTLPLSWMEEQLALNGQNSNDLVSMENQMQASDQVSVRNCIGTLRFINAHDWSDFVEEHSHVENILRKEAAGIYPLMDFATRDSYRHAIERMAKSGALSETEVARAVVQLADEQGQQQGAHSKCTHIGYYLVDRGLTEMETYCKLRIPLYRKMKAYVSRKAAPAYILSITLLSFLLTGLLSYFVAVAGINGVLFHILFAVISLVGTLQLASAMVNWILTLVVSPKLLPRMDFSKGIPPDKSTMIVVPTMLVDKAYIENMTEALEIRYLANPGRYLYYALLTDFTDALQEHMPEDSDLLLYAQEKIVQLNEKYGSAETDLFFLFHRSRTWNKKERKWMGFERKRGKLSTLNALLRGRKEPGFTLTCGRVEALPPIKYVITLDSDTQLPMGAACKLIATMAHPLNKATYSSKWKRVMDGYGILQPRVAAAIPKSPTTLYVQMQGSQTGIDPYTRASSDVYQDLFGEGSFIGKGIYDIDVFEEALKGKFQRNRILSHDLLEGCYARSGLVSDVVLYEENPVSYPDDMKRHHRWIRGDWQIGAWMLPFVTNAHNRLTKNHLSLLSRWKIMDNLRRSLLPGFSVLFLIMGWTILPFPWFWTLTITLILTLPDMARSVWQLTHKPLDLKFNAHLSEIAIFIRDIVTRFIFTLATLPYEALVYTDAIARTNWRMVVSRRYLLEWTSSASVAARSYREAGRWINMWFGPFLAVACTALIVYLHPAGLFVAAPILVLWALAPAIIRKISRPLKEKKIALTDGQYTFLHKTARKTWGFFETFVTAADHWLPPDNYQEEPLNILAHRTSPTNMGLALLANLTAYDFGYISAAELLKRCAATIGTMLQLERYKGHFYNWYNTLTLDPLAPKYVSAVDSGNLIGHLLILKQGLMNLADQPVFHTRFFDGVIATIEVIKDKLTKDNRNAVKEIEHCAALGKKTTSLNGLKVTLTELIRLTGVLESKTFGEVEGVLIWTNRLRIQIESALSDLRDAVPWLDLLPIPPEYKTLISLDDIPLISSVKTLAETQLQKIAVLDQTGIDSTGRLWLQELKALLLKSMDHNHDLLMQIGQLTAYCEDFSRISYDFLYDRSTHLLRIGYNVDEERKDDSYYDLLASEARLGVFVAIAQGQLPQEAWFALGRLLTATGTKPVLLSWSGSMFEYLMPQLVMPAFKNTLLHQTNRAMVERQIAYAEQRGIPWGISESGYHAFDGALNYQYRAFGVPGLGLKRGLEEDLVIAPYATALALMVLPEKACAQLQLLSQKGFEGEYGFYEAVDYTPARLPRDKKFEIIKSFMVHHQGMSLLSLSYLLLQQPMQRRFASDLRFQASLLLLQERVPRATVFQAHTAEVKERSVAVSGMPERRIMSADTPLPEIQLLSNGHYQVMVTNGGGGYSRWKDLAVTRWREDGITDGSGIFSYIREPEKEVFWSNTYQPTLKAPQHYEVVFSPDHIEYRRTDNNIETCTKVVVSPEDDVEMRKMRITNKTNVVKVLEVTSYTEIVMTTQAADEAHPAFSNLFVQTEILPEYAAILATRRPRSEEEQPPWMFHHMDIQGVTMEECSYETDRMRFVGRGRTLSDPAAMHLRALSGSDGPVLDPVMAIRYRFSIRPGQTAAIDMVYGVSDTKENCLTILHKYRDLHLRKRAAELSWTHNQVLLRQLNATDMDVQLFDRLATSIIFINPLLRPASKTIQSNLRGQSSLWSHSISGDLPIVLLHMHESENIEIARQMILAHAYWRVKGIAIDLVILNEEHGSYRQLLQEQISGLVNSSLSGHTIDSRSGNIFFKHADQVSPEDRILFESIARVVLDDNKGTLAEQIGIAKAAQTYPVKLQILEQSVVYPDHTLKLPEDLLFFNGIGGFSADGRAYKINTDEANITPAPWVNVIANPGFGTVVAENGSSYTWAVNAHEYRLTPWNNDMVCNAGGEAFYIRDELSGIFWSPTPFPIKGNKPFLTTHGFGYSLFEHYEQGIASEMCVFVDAHLPLKFVVLKLKNLSSDPRKLSVTGFMEIVLGDTRSKTGMHILPDMDAGSRTLIFRNRYNSIFAQQVTFFRVLGGGNSFTTDRGEFIGRNRTLQDPGALYREKLSGRLGAGKDSCAAIQVKIDLLPDEEREMVFLLGSTNEYSLALDYITRFKEPEAVHIALDGVKRYWKHKLEPVRVSTPDKALNIMANGWLLYQNICCRLFARTGFYQSGGAFGFRDQLQDVLAVLHTDPSLAREQIILSAAHQFIQGDVQHWWHPPDGRGVRTRCSDDLLWLPYVVARCISVTGDREVLSVIAGFLEGRELQPGEESLYDLPQRATEENSIYQHCVRSIKYSLKQGIHGLPLMGSGDWNDGMDKVGILGQGESVWLAFFLYDVLNKFAVVAKEYGDVSFSDFCLNEARRLQENIEAEAWDGQWYLRAWFDNGAALGTKTNTECRIDAIAQSWSVLSGGGSMERAVEAMASLDRQLVRRDANLIQLLTPAFDKSALNPGYIKGYIPGVRENGGQYTHAAIWAIMAFAKLGDRSKVYELLSMILPINHSLDPDSSNIYKVEPYVMAADVYANEFHEGRGGWTWYTGSAGWMYQLLMDSFIGIERRENMLTFNPCFPTEWESVEVKYAFGEALYNITIIQTEKTEANTWRVDNRSGPGNTIELKDDQSQHTVTVWVSVLQ